MNLRSVLAPALLSILSAFAAAGETLTDPTAAYKVGIDDSGVLYDRATGVGFARLGDGYDPIKPHKPRDSWSVFAGSKAYDADPNLFYGNEGITAGSIVTGSHTVTATVGLGPGDGTVVQRFSFVAPNVLHITVTVTNLALDATDFRYRRDVDWDIDPLPADPADPAEFVNVPSTAPANVVETSYFGFEEPTAPFKSTGTGTFGPADLGGGITVDLGTLASGASATTDFYYAISAAGQSPAELRAQLAALGVGYSIVGYGTDGDFGTSPHSAALGIATPVPEPASFAALALGVGFVAQRRRT